MVDEHCLLSRCHKFTSIRKINCNLEKVKRKAVKLLMEITQDLFFLETYFYALHKTAHSTF